MRRSRKRPYGTEHIPLDPERLRGMARTERGPQGAEFTVRQVRGSGKAYTCPGCNRPIQPGSAHVVAWTNEHLFGQDAGLAERRHWHGGCWRAAQRGRPTP